MMMRTFLKLFLAIGALLFTATTASTATATIRAAAPAARKLEDMAVADVSGDDEDFDATNPPQTSSPTSEDGNDDYEDFDATTSSPTSEDGNDDYEDFDATTSSPTSEDGNDDYEDFDATTSSPTSDDGSSDDGEIIGVGTRVSVYDEDTDEWTDGTVTEHVEGTYTVVWDDDGEGGDSAVDYYDDYGNDLAQLNTAAADNNVGGDFSLGTAVSFYNEEGGEWVAGKISEFSAGTYTVIGQDGSQQKKYNKDEYDALWQAVDDAGFDGEIVDVGTRVSVYDEGTDQWWDGTVTEYEEGTYTVVWDDDDAGGDSAYDDYGNDLAQLNRAAADNNVGGDFRLGTAVSFYNEEGREWVEGTISEFSSGTYTVIGHDGSQQKKYNKDEYEELWEAVADVGLDGTIVDVGTRVSVYDEDTQEWKDGTVTEYEEGTYTVVWDDDGEGGDSVVDYYEDYGNDLAQLNRAAADNSDAHPPGTLEAKSGMTAVGKTFLSLSILAVVLVGSIFGLRRFYANRRQVEEGVVEKYLDETNRLSKII